MNFDATAAAEFLTRNFSPGLLNVVGIAADASALARGVNRTVAATFDPRGEGAALASFIEKQRGSRNVYFSPNRVGTRIQKKASKTDIAALTMAHVDIDPRDGADLEAERTRIRKLIDDYPIRPQIVVNSGNGFQLFWRLEAPLVAPRDIDRVEAINRHLQAAFGGDHCHNVDRLLRVPFTDNLPNAKKQRAGRTAVLAAVVWEEKGAVPAELLMQSFPTHTAQFAELLAENPRFRERWVGGVDGLTDTSRSACDMSVLSMLAKAGYDKATAISILKLFPHGKASQEGDRYVDRMWDAVTTENSTSRGAAAGSYEEPGNTELQRIVDTWNQKYGVVQLKGQAFVLEEKSEGGHELLRTSAFELLNRNVTYFDGKKSCSATRGWLSHPARREFRGGIVFCPGEPGPADAYNLWRGFAVVPGRGNFGKFLAHLRDNVCGGDLDLYDWLIGWIAQLLQAPQRKLGTSVCLVGAQGTGKTIVGFVLGKLLGRHYRQVGRDGLVTGRFNRHMEGVLLLQVDEAVFAGDRAGANVLKDLITSPTLQIEAKGVDVSEVPNYIRLLVTTNNEWAVQAAPEERRFCVLRVGDAHLQDTLYFGEMIRELEEENGYAGLLEYLLAYRVDETALRKIPVTEALLEQKVRSLPAELTWWLDILESGVLPGDVNGEGQSPNGILHAHYTRSLQNAGVSHRSSQTILGITFKEMFPELRTRERMYFDPEAGKRISGKVRQFPSLADCRAEFARRIGRTVPWGDPRAWKPDLVGGPAERR